MHLDKLLHSKVDLDDPLDLKYEYEGVYAQVTRHLRPSGPVSALFVGDGGDVFPRYMEIVHPGSYLEVIEIDPVVTKAAFEAFGVPASSTIQHFAMDARNRVADLIRDKRRGEQVPSFDFIYGDAFSDFSVPYHLTTLEYTQSLAELMTDDGVYLLNLIDMLEIGNFLNAVVNTCRQVFPQVEVLLPETTPDARTTFVIVCSKKPVDLSRVPTRVKKEHGFVCESLAPSDLDRLARRNGDLVLRDDYAPIEHCCSTLSNATPPGRTIRATSLGRSWCSSVRGSSMLSSEPVTKNLRPSPGSAGFGIGSPPRSRSKESWSKRSSSIEPKSR